MVSWRSAPTSTRSGGAPTRPSRATSHPVLRNISSRAAARQVKLDMVAPVTNPTELSVVSPGSQAPARRSTTSAAGVGSSGSVVPSRATISSTVACGVTGRSVSDASQAPACSWACVSAASISSTAPPPRGRRAPARSVPAAPEVASVVAEPGREHPQRGAPAVLVAGRDVLEHQALSRATGLQRRGQGLPHRRAEQLRVVRLEEGARDRLVLLEPRDQELAQRRVPQPPPSGMGVNASHLPTIAPPEHVLDFESRGGAPVRKGDDGLSAEGPEK